MIIILGLIFKQPNLSMVIILTMTTLSLYISRRQRIVASYQYWRRRSRRFWNFNYTAKLLHGYQMDRITVWLNPGSDAQNKRIQYHSIFNCFRLRRLQRFWLRKLYSKLAYLPECHTDFIFAIIAEEFGFLGCLFVLGLFVALVHRGLRISKRCPDMYGKLLAIGITFVFGFQAFLNICQLQAHSSMPVTGVTLPFISYGGTSIIVSLAMVGILLNISKQRIKN